MSATTQTIQSPSAPAPAGSECTDPAGITTVRTSPDSGGAASRTSGRWSSATRCGRGGWRTPRASRFSTTSRVAFSAELVAEISARAASTSRP